MHTDKKYLYGWFVCGLAALFYLYEYILRITPSVMSDQLMEHYQISASAFGNFSALYYYIYTPMQLIVGLLFDRYRYRLLLILATVLCGVGTLMIAVLPGLFWGGIGRFITGLGSAFAFVGVLKVASIWLASNRFAMIAGLATALGMVGGMIGDNVMSWTVFQFGWYSTLIGLAVLGGSLALVLWLALKNEPMDHTQSQMTFKILFQQIVLLLKKRQFWIVGFIGTALYISLSVFAELWGIPYFQQARHFSSEQSAFIVSMVFLGWAIGGPLAGWLADSFNNQKFPLLIGGIFGACLISAILYIPLASVTLLSILSLFFGMVSSAQVIVFAISKDNIEPRLAGSAVALMNALVMLGGFIFQPWVGRVLDLNWSGQIGHNGVRLYSFEAYQTAFIILPILFLLSGFAAFWLKKTYRKFIPEKAGTIG